MNTAIKTKQQAFDLFENTRAEVLAYCRWTAEKLAKERGRITIDDVRECITLPEGIHHSVFGAVFRDKGKWEAVGFTPTKRDTSHGRLVQVYRLKHIERKQSGGKLEQGLLL